MKILLITFSGTGNTLLCSNFIKEAFLKYGHEISQYQIEKNQIFNFDLNEFDCIGFGYPIHAFNAPEVFVKFIKKLPKMEKEKKFFIFKVSGEPFKFNDASSSLFVRILKKKNYSLIAEKHFLMPYNIIIRYKDSLAKQMYLYLKPLCEVFVLEILKKDYEKIKYHFDKKILSFLFRIEWAAPKINAPFHKVDKKKCIDCKKCIEACPVDALYIDKKGRIRQRKNCTLCMRCSFYCPTDAMKMGIINPWVVNGDYKYKKLNENKNLSSDFVNYHTKGYFKLFRKYFYNQNKLLEKYNLEIPVVYKEDENLNHLKD